MQAFNLPPAMVEDRFHEFSGSGKTGEKTAEGVAKIWTRAMHRQLADANSWEEMISIVNKFSGIAQSSVDPLQRKLVAKTMSMFLTDIGDKSTLDYLRPYMETGNLSDRVAELRGAREDASTEAQRKEIEEAILMLEPMIQKIQEFEDK
jgi:hypothetical protein